METRTFTSPTFVPDGLLTAPLRPPLRRMGSSGAGSGGDLFQRPTSKFVTRRLDKTAMTIRHNISVRLPTTQLKSHVGNIRKVKRVHFGGSFTSKKAESKAS